MASQYAYMYEIVHMASLLNDCNVDHCDRINGGFEYLNVYYYLHVHPKNAQDWQWQF